MTKEEYDAIMTKMKNMAGCPSCVSYDGVRCRACTWMDAMDCVDAFYDDNMVESAPEVATKMEV